MLVLKLEKKDGTFQEMTLQKLPAVLGRLGRSDIRIEDASVSREHARLFESGGRLFIADLNSSNGTFVNDRRVTRSEVETGDRIRLGRVVFSLQREPSAADAGGGVPAPSDFDIEESPAGESPQPSAAEAPQPPAAKSQRSMPAERRVEPRGVARPAKTAAAAAPQSGEDIRFSGRVLQYRRIPAGKKTGLLRSDLSQHHPYTRVVAIIIILVLATALFFLCRWITQSAMPAPWEREGVPNDYETGE
jgi:hypothetical protein